MYKNGKEKAFKEKKEKRKIASRKNTLLSVIFNSLNGEHSNFICLQV
jgi:hypothetical protein